MRPWTATRYMSAERFTLDTNVLVYALDTREPSRQRMALAIVHAAAELDCVLTYQAVSEFFVAARRKLGMPPARAAAASRDYLRLFRSAGYDRAAVEIALRESVAGRFPFWDALLLATAEAAGCTAALSEDMADGAQLGGIVVRHPFEGNSLAPAVRQLLDI
jgi:predicted nucleic acid-binding protein